jgi:ketosteroid isomerase-like protein
VKIMEEEITAIKLSNERFYRALTNLDIEAMDAIWSHDEGVRCIHPGWEVIEGWEVIRQSWDIIFANTTSLTVEPSEVKVRVEGDMAWVCCLETITSGNDTAGLTLARATNLFIHATDGWKMILHHASQVPAEAHDGAAAEDDDEPTVH